jgi:hypothetical protein
MLAGNGTTTHSLQWEHDGTPARQHNAARHFAGLLQARTQGDQAMDFSTINTTILESQPRYVLKPSEHLQESSGNGCHGDPPGFPTYFTRCVYNRHGATPRGAPQYVITHEGTHFAVIDNNLDYDKWHGTYIKLWNPLPLDHERTRLWIVSTYIYFNRCYQDSERLEHGKSGMLIFPVPNYKLKPFTDDPRWNEEYRAAAKAEADAFNRMEIERATRIATPDNHKAVVTIRRFYPDYQPELDLISSPPNEHVGMWWETEASQPSEGDCAKTQRWGDCAKTQRWGEKHPFNGTWCQWCGRRYAK